MTDNFLFRQTFSVNKDNRT